MPQKGEGRLWLRPQKAMQRSRNRSGHAPAQLDWLRMAGPSHDLQFWLTACSLLLSAAAAAQMGPAGTTPGPRRCALAGRSAQGPAVPGESNGVLM